MTYSSLFRSVFLLAVMAGGVFLLTHSLQAELASGSGVDAVGLDGTLLAHADPVKDAVDGAGAVLDEVKKSGPTLDDLDTGDTAWMIVATALVLFMTPGLAFFYGGLVRRKNVLSVLMQCFFCMCLMTVLWVTIGYSLAFGGGSGFIGNFDFAFMNGVGLEPREGDTIPHVLFMCFHGMFAIITPALILGAYAERMKFLGFTIFSALWLLLVYCPVCHWVWANPEGYEGFFALGNDGALDFAGGTVVHINAGIAALVAALILGKRQGYPARISPPHNLPFAVLGAGMLWFGWFGFNGGSQLAADGIAANALVVTHVAAAAGGLIWALIEWVKHGKPTTLGLITGAVAGLVAITPGSGFVNVMGALCIGGGGSAIAYIAVAFVKEKLGYDDSLDVWGVHGVAGIWGAIAAGLWATQAVNPGANNGAFYGNTGQIAIQLKAVIYTLVYSGLASFVLLKVVQLTVGIKSDGHSERIGLDVTEHAESAYTVVD
jgi:ammonium transporter, Amt family